MSMQLRTRHRESGRRQPATGAAHGVPDPVRGAPERETRAPHMRDAAAAAVGTASAGAVMLALVLMAAAVVIALVIALGILLANVGANGGNAIVKGIHESANFVAGSFTGMIRFTGHPKRAISVNWGIAALVYLLVGAIVARVVFGVGRGGLPFEQRHRTSAAGY